MRALVTGGAGFIGSNLVAALLARGAAVTVLDDLSTGDRRNLAAHPRLAVVEGDVRDETAVARAIDGADTVFHLAASVGNARSIADPLTDSEVNVIGTLRLLLAARERGVGRLVASSSAAVYGEPRRVPVREDHPLAPQTPYACSKLAMETQALAFAALAPMTVVCLRYFNVYGERQRFDPYGNVIPIFARAMLAGAPVTVHGDGSQTRDFVHVDDVVAANLAAAQAGRPGGAYNVASGTAVTVRALIAAMEAAVGRPARVEHGPPRPGDVRHSLADIGAARRTLGFRPRVRLADGLSRTLQFLRGDGEAAVPPAPAPAEGGLQQDVF